MLLTAVERGSRGMEQGPRMFFPLLLILLLVLLFTKLRRRRGAHMYRGAGGSPSQTLADRFARGEIDRAEYQHRLAVLNGDDIIPPAPPTSAPAAPPAESGYVETEDAADQLDDDVSDDVIDDDGTA